MTCSEPRLAKGLGTGATSLEPEAVGGATTPTAGGCDGGCVDCAAGWGAGCVVAIIDYMVR